METRIPVRPRRVGPNPALVTLSALALLAYLIYCVVVLIYCVVVVVVFVVVVIPVTIVTGILGIPVSAVLGPSGFTSAESTGNSIGSGVMASTAVASVAPSTSTYTVSATSVTGMSSLGLSGIRIVDSLAGLAGSTGSTGLMSVLRSLAVSTPLSLAGIGSMVAILANAFNPAGWLNSLASVIPTSAVPVLGEVQGLLGVIGGLARFAGVDSFGTSANVLAASVPSMGLLDTAGAGTVHAVTGIVTGGGSPWLP